MTTTPTIQTFADTIVPGDIVTYNGETFYADVILYYEGTVEIHTKDATAPRRGWRIRTLRNDERVEVTR